MIGGHSQRIYGSNHKTCEGYIAPYLTASLMERFRHYDEQSQECKGYVPYVGSSVEQICSSAKNIETPTHSERI